MNKKEIITKIMAVQDQAYAVTDAYAFLIENDIEPGVDLNAVFVEIRKLTKIFLLLLEKECREAGIITPEEEIEQ